MRPLDSGESTRQGECGPRSLESGARGPGTAARGGCACPWRPRSGGERVPDQRRRDARPRGLERSSPEAVERGNHAGRRRGGAGEGALRACGRLSPGAAWSAVRPRQAPRAGHPGAGRRCVASARTAGRDGAARLPPPLRPPRARSLPPSRLPLPPSAAAARCCAPGAHGARRGRRGRAGGPGSECGAEPGPGARACLRPQETAGESRGATGPVPPGFSPGTRGQPGGRSRGPANSEAGTPRRQLEVGTLRAAASPGATESRPAPAPANSGSGSLRGSSAPTHNLPGRVPGATEDLGAPAGGRAWSALPTVTVRDQLVFFPRGVTRVRSAGPSPRR